MSRQTFALLNLILIFGAAWIGMRAYVKSAPDVSRFRSSQLLGAKVRGWYLSNLEPFGKLFARLGVSPTFLSYTQLGLSVLAGLAYAFGLIFVAGFLVLFAGTLDILDGNIARRTNGASRRGAFLDSVIDRYAEFMSYVGIMVFFQSGWQVWAALFAILGGVMVSYTRARGEGLGVRCETGLLQRPERVVLLGFGSIFSSAAVHVAGGMPVPSNQVLLALTLLALAVLSNVTALQRARSIVRELTITSDE